MKTWKSELERLIRERWDVGERFTTTDVYRLEAYFQKRRPNNSHIRASLLKILQHLRDEAIIEFESVGVYRLLPKILS
jgi:hypothetical protein